MDQLVARARISCKPYVWKVCGCSAGTSVEKGFLWFPMPCRLHRRENSRARCSGRRHHRRQPPPPPPPPRRLILCRCNSQEHNCSDSTSRSGRSSRSISACAGPTPALTSVGSFHPPRKWMMRPSGRSSALENSVCRNLFEYVSFLSNDSRYIPSTHAILHFCFSASPLMFFHATPPGVLLGRVLQCSNL